MKNWVHDEKLWDKHRIFHLVILYKDIPCGAAIYNTLKKHTHTHTAVSELPYHSIYTKSIEPES